MGITGFTRFAHADHACVVDADVDVSGKLDQRIDFTLIGEIGDESRGVDTRCPQFADAFLDAVGGGGHHDPRAQITQCACTYETDAKLSACSGDQSASTR